MFARSSSRNWLSDEFDVSKAAPASQGISTTSDLGSFWWDPQLSEKDPVMDKKRSENGIKRLLPVESGSQFALENLPIGDRLL